MFPATVFFQARSWRGIPLELFFKQVIKCLARFSLSIRWGAIAESLFRYRKIITKVGPPFILNQLRNRFPALLGCVSAIETAVQATVQVGVASRAHIPSTDSLTHSEFIFAGMTALHCDLFYPIILSKTS